MHYAICYFIIIYILIIILIKIDFEENNIFYFSSGAEGVRPTSVYLQRFLHRSGLIPE